MHILMNKKQENDLFVYYRFETNIAEKPYIDEDGNTRYLLETKYGVCKFNKKTYEIVFEKELTDTYYVNRDYERICMLSKLVQCAKKNMYPDLLEYASG